MLSYRLSDLLFLLLGCCALLYSLREGGDWELRHALHIPAAAQRSQPESRAEQLTLAPLITDLDGDGVNGQR